MAATVSPILFFKSLAQRGAFSLVGLYRGCQSAVTSNRVVQSDRQAFAVNYALLGGAEELGVLVGSLAPSDFEWQGTRDTAAGGCNAFARGQSGESQEDLVNGAVDVRGGQNGSQVLDLNLSLGEVGGDPELLEDVGGGVQADDHVFGRVVALGVRGVAVVGHAREQVEDEARGAVQLRVVLLDVRASADHGKAETCPLRHQAMVSVVSPLSLAWRQLLDTALLLASFGSDVVMVSQLKVVLEHVEAEGLLRELAPVDTRGQVGDVVPVERLPLRCNHGYSSETKGLSNHL